MTPIHLSLTSALSPSTAEVQNSRVREDVVVYEVGRTDRLHQNHSGGRGEGPQIQGEVRLPPGVHHERVHGAAQAMRHHESRREPGLQRLRDCHTERLTVKVGGIV